MRLFQSFRDRPAETRQSLRCEVSARFAAMDDAEFAQFLETLPEATRDTAIRLRAEMPTSRH